MTITFGYLFPSIFSIIYAILTFLLGIFLYLAGKSLNEEEKSFNNANLFKVAAMICITWEIIYLAIPDVIDYSNSDYLAVVIYRYTLFIIELLIHIITIGLIFIIIGLANPEQNGKKLFYSGIFWIISHTAYIFYTIFYLILYSTPENSYSMIWSITILCSLTFFYTYIVAFILFFQFSFASKELNLKTSTLIIFAQMINFIIRLTQHLI